MKKAKLFFQNSLIIKWKVNSALFHYSRPKHTNHPGGGGGGGGGEALIIYCRLRGQ